MPRVAKKQPDSPQIDTTPGGIASVDKALHLLALFDSKKPEWTLTQLAQHSGLYKSTALRLLVSLEGANLLSRNSDGSYRLGHEISRLHAVYRLGATLDTVVLPVLQRLVQMTGESAAFHVRQGHERVCLFRVDSPNALRDHIKAGDILPLFKGSGGRVLAAFDPTLYEEPEYKAERNVYKRIVQDGYMTAKGDRLQEIAGISAPVFSRNRIVAALTLTMPEHRYQDVYVRHVLALARELTVLMEQMS